MFICNLSRTHEDYKTNEGVHHTYIWPEGKKVQLVRSRALALTLTINHLANKPQQTTSTLFAFNLRQHNGL